MIIKLIDSTIPRIGQGTFHNSTGIFLLNLLLFLLFQPVPNHGQGIDTTDPQSIGYRILSRAGKVEIPFTSIHNLIILPISINGSIPLNFILDCGVSHTIVTEPAFAQIMRLKPERALNILGAGGDNQVRAHICTGNRIEFKGVIGDGIPIILLQEDYLPLSAMLGVPIFGLLGSDLFRDLVIGIDYINHNISIVDPSRFKAPHGYRHIPMRIQSGKPHLRIKLEQTEGDPLEIDVLADLGASHFLLVETASDPRLVVPDKHLVSNVGFGLAGPIKGSYARVERVSVGSHRLSKPIIAYTTQYAPVDNQGIRHGTIGGEFMCRFHIWFDVSRESIYLHQNRQFKRRFSQDKSGLGIMAGGQMLDQAIVYDVRPESPAFLAGVRPGDQILKANGAKIRGIERINTLMRQRDGKRIHLVVERDGKTFEFRFHLMNGL